MSRPLTSAGSVSDQFRGSASASVDGSEPDSQDQASQRQEMSPLPSPSKDTPGAPQSRGPQVTNIRCVSRAEGRNDDKLSDRVDSPSSGPGKRHWLIGQ